jgi:uncharacterized protein
VVLSPDLVRARRRDDVLYVTELKGSEITEAKRLAQMMLDRVHSCIDFSLEEVEAALGDVDRASKYEKVWAGLKKIILENCEFTALVNAEPIALRRTLFEVAALKRAALADGEDFDRSQVLSEVALHFLISSEELEGALFGDLKGAQRLQGVPTLDAASVVEEYERQHLQGVLLRAVQLRAEVSCSNPNAYRRLFQKLKFRQLLFRLFETEHGYTIEIEGPFSLFEAVTKYGMQFALVLPALMECDEGKIAADLRWGKERRSLRFEKAWRHSPIGELTSDGAQDFGIRPDVQALLKSLSQKRSRWSIEVCAEILHIPGEGVCVPDLKFSALNCQPIYLEVMGFWSRDAIFRRVEWAQSGQHERVIFAVSSRLRVSEAVLPSNTASSLYVYKGTMSASAVLKQVEALAESK